MPMVKRVNHPERESAALIGPLTCCFSGADDEIRTRDPHLGKVMLYQLSHVRSDRKIIKLATGPDNTGLDAQSRWSAGRRSIRSVSMPSSIVATASPIMA